VRARVRVIREVAGGLALRTEDAFSVDRYASWTSCASMLLARGLTVPQAEVILRSKYMRWAANSSSAPYGRATSKDLARLLDQDPSGVRSLLEEESVPLAPLAPPTNVTFGAVYGNPWFQEGRIRWMFRKGQRVRFYDQLGTQIEVEQSNVAPAIAFATSRGWVQG